MGCHTWFYRPLTQEEIERIRPYAKKDLQDYISKIESHEYELYEDEDKSMTYEKWASDIKEVLDTANSKNDFTWLRLGYGCEGFLINEIEGKFYLDLSRPYMETNIKFQNPLYLHDVFRTNGYYPKRVIHNSKELKRTLKRWHINLSKNQKKLLDNFWKMYHFQKSHS